MSLSGPDAAHFLQGLTTVNITPQVQTHGGRGFYSAFLNASGRVLHDVFIYPTAQSRTWTARNGQDEGFLIEVDANEAEALAKHLKKFKLRAKVAIRVVDVGEWGVYAAWGQGAQPAPDSRAEGIGCVDGRAPGLGSRLVVDQGSKVGLDAEEVGVGSYGVRRMMMGVPEGQGEILKESALPQESNIDYMGGIDFRKGCYVGQELTIRTHHTGVVRKRILPVQLYNADERQPESLGYDSGSKLNVPLQGANISRVGKKGRSAGKWIGGVGNVGLALCRLEIMTNTVLTGEGGQWKLEDEFKVIWEAGEGREGGEAKIKAFIPHWHSERAESLRVRHGT